jgi:hypothetical protein
MLRSECLALVSMVEKDAPATWTNEDERRKHRICTEEERVLL